MSNNKTILPDISEGKGIGVDWQIFDIQNNSQNTLETKYGNTITIEPNTFEGENSIIILKEALNKADVIREGLDTLSRYEDTDDHIPEYISQSFGMIYMKVNNEDNKTLVPKKPIIFSILIHSDQVDKSYISNKHFLIDYQDDIELNRVEQTKLQQKKRIKEQENKEVTNILGKDDEILHIKKILKKRSEAERERLNRLSEDLLRELNSKPTLKRVSPNEYKGNKQYTLEYTANFKNEKWIKFQFNTNLIETTTISINNLDMPTKVFAISKDYFTIIPFRFYTLSKSFIANVPKNTAIYLIGIQKRGPNYYLAIRSISAFQLKNKKKYQLFFEMISKEDLIAKLATLK